MVLLHPARGDALTDLEKLLWRFRIASREAQQMIRGFLAYPNVGDAINADLLAGLTNQALIIVTKFLEIWDDSGKLAKIEPKIVNLRRALSPIVDRIHVWRGLRAIRNTSLAHAYLDKGELVAPWELLESGKAPAYHAEIILLLYLVHMAVLCILHVFEETYLAIDVLTGHDKGDAELHVGPGIRDDTQMLPTLNAIALDTDARMESEFGARVAGPFVDRFQAKLKPRAG